MGMQRDNAKANGHEIQVVYSIKTLHTDAYGVSECIYSYSTTDQLKACHTLRKVTGRNHVFTFRRFEDFQ